MDLSLFKIIKHSCTISDASAIQIVSMDFDRSKIKLFTSILYYY